MKTHNLYLILITFFVAQFSFATNSSEYAAIRGTLHFPDYEVKEITIYAAEEGKPVVVATTKVNALGEFGCLLPITTPGFYYIDYGQFKSRNKHLVRLYLEPKLDIDVTITSDNYVLSGKNIGQNALVQKANQIYDEFAVFSILGGTKTYLDFYPFLESGLVKAETFINSVKTSDERFNKLLKLAVATDVEELTLMFFRMPRPVHPDKNNRPAIIKQWQVDQKFTNPDLLKLANGLSLMSNYFFYRMMYSVTLPSRTDFAPEAITHISNPDLKDVFLRDYIATSRMKIEEYETVAPKIRPYLISPASKEFLLDYEKVLHKNVGQKGLEFTYKDVNDKPVSFSDFRGKYVYIDLWATWCGPCKAEIPHMKKIEEDYHGKNIVFISLSLDKPKDIQKWKDFVKKEQLKGIQLMADKDFSSDVAKNYEVNGIPRFLLFDTKGNIINADALRPSNPELRVQLDKLLKG